MCMKYEHYSDDEVKISGLSVTETQVTYSYTTEGKIIQRYNKQHCLKCMF